MSEIRIIECPGCGARIDSNKKICDYCGSEIIMPEVKKEKIDKAPEVQVENQSRTEEISQGYIKNTYIQAQRKKISGLAVAAFILSLIGLGPVAFILGIIANVKISRPDSNLTGRGFAIAAIVLSIIQLFAIIGSSTAG
jgi:predicted amidophosphoribosyltransferase